MEKPVLTKTAECALKELRADAITLRNESLAVIIAADCGVLEKTSMSVTAWSNWFESQAAAVKTAAEIDREERRLMGLLHLTAKDLEGHR